MTIALIEDDDAVLDSLRLLLEGHGMTVRCFDSAEAFLATGADSTSTCIVSDVRMPGMSGLDLQRELKARSCSVGWSRSRGAGFGGRWRRAWALSTEEDTMDRFFGHPMLRRVSRPLLVGVHVSPVQLCAIAGSV